MFILQRLNIRRPYIAAVFSDRDALDAHRRTIPTELNAQLEEVEVDSSEYPLFVLERHEPTQNPDKPPMEPLFHADLEEFLNGIEREDDDEDVEYATFFVFWEDTTPPDGRQGTDYMGAYDHHHVDGHFLDEFTRASKQLDPFLAQSREHHDAT